MVFKIKIVLLSCVLTESIFPSQHAMFIDTRNSPILPKKGALIKINQVRILLYMNRELNKHFRLALKQLFFVTAGVGRLYRWRCQIPEGGL